MNVSRVFPMARMDGLVAVLTTFLMGLPVLFLVLGLILGQGWPLAAVGLALAVLYAGVWLVARPRSLKLDAQALEIHWPMRSRTIARSDIEDVRVLTRKELRRSLGFAVRIGVGGLFGVFGYLWTKRYGLVSIYSTRIDQMVAIQRRTGRMLLLSPNDPEAFVAAFRTEPA